MSFRNEKLYEWQRREYITSAAKASRIIGISPSFYLDILKGKKLPSLKTLEKISKKTGMSITELLEEGVSDGDNA